MHDFMLAKEIVDDIMKIVKDEKLSHVDSASLEIGQIALAHDGHAEHVEDISVDNLKFGIKNIVKGTILEKTKFNIKKVQGEHWQLVSIEGE
jgi:Zn finger protein HypA/HybF involved in hydrogenase expression